MPRDGSGDVKRTYIEVQIVMRKGVLRGDVDLNKRGMDLGLKRDGVAWPDEGLKRIIAPRGSVL